MPELIKKNHKVIALSRSDEGVKKLHLAGATGLKGDILEPDMFIDKLSGIELIILLAMPDVTPGKRMNSKKISELKKEVNGYFKNTLELARKYNVAAVLPSGTSYITKGEEIADESWPIARFGMAGIGEDTDKMVDNVLKSGNPKIVQMIFGQIYGNGGLFKLMYNWMKKGKFRVIGDGKNYIPRIYAGDAALSIIKAVEKMPVGEKFIITDDTPVKSLEFSAYMAQCMRVPEPKKIPAFIVRLAVGKLIAQTVTMNCIVSNKKAKEILGWKPQYPSYKEGLEAVIKEIESNP